MKRRMKILTRWVLAFGVVFLSLRPSITNRVEPGCAGSCVGVTASAVVAHIDFPSKCLPYRSSFETNEKKTIAQPVLSLGFFNSVVFHADRFYTASSSGAGPEVLPAETFRILRI